MSFRWNLQTIFLVLDRIRWHFNKKRIVGYYEFHEKFIISINSEFQTENDVRGVISDDL